jgi:pimeloyl-ACP methyl ester carboxylesterase
MQKTIYCISGLGADEKVFSNLRMQQYTLKYIPWLKPEKGETLQAYAQRMAASITDHSPVLMGVSFGGMVGIEIAKQLRLKRLIIISSIKSTGELPAWMRIVGKLQLNKLLPTRSYKYSEKVDNNRLGVSTPEEKEMVRAYRRSADPEYLSWAINQVVNWKNDWQPDNLIHIHGEHDKIFPVKKINASLIVKEGTHMMIYNRAQEISDYIEKELGN